MDALAGANRIRLARAELRRKLFAGDITAQQILTDMPVEAMTMTISQLLDAQYKWGTQRVRKLLRTLAISETRKLGGLTTRETQRIIDALNGHVSGEGERYGERWLAA